MAASFFRQAVFEAATMMLAPDGRIDRYQPGSVVSDRLGYAIGEDQCRLSDLDQGLSRGSVYHQNDSQRRPA
jgi:hypothetical protein